MNNTQTILRIAVQKKTKWDAESREITIQTFLAEVCQVLAPAVLEHLAENDSKKLESMFFDWVTHRKARTADQRINLMVSSVANSATPVPCALAKALEDPDLSKVGVAENVVALRSAR